MYKIEVCRHAVIVKGLHRNGLLKAISECATYFWQSATHGIVKHKCDDCESPRRAGGMCDGKCDLYLGKGTSVNCQSIVSCIDGISRMLSGRA